MDELTADMLKGAWYDYNPRGHHKHQIWKNRFLVASWKDAGMMCAELAELGMDINSEGSVVLKERS